MWRLYTGHQPVLAKQMEGLELALYTDSLSFSHYQGHLTADLSGMCSTFCFLCKCHSFCVTLEVNMDRTTYHLDVQYNPLQAPSFPESITQGKRPPC